MKRVKNRNKYSKLVLLLIVLGITLGYAALTSNLNIVGTSKKKMLHGMSIGIMFK